MFMSKKRWWVPWVFLSVPLAMYAIWVIWPIIQTFAFSFTEWDGMTPSTFIGFENYKNLFNDPIFWTALKNNFRWLILFVAIPIPVGLLVAMLFDVKLPGGKIFKTIMYLSMTLSFVVIAQIWSWIYDPKNGALAVTLRALGFANLDELLQAAFDFLIFVIIPIIIAVIVVKIIDKSVRLTGKKALFAYISLMALFIILAHVLKIFWDPQIETSRFSKNGFPWLSDPNMVTYSLIMSAIWRQIPYVMVLYLAGLKGVPPALVEASIVDGANWWQRFYNVILPMLKPATIVAITISVIDSLRAFDIVYAMTRGGPFNTSSVLANFMYIETFNNYRMGYGSSIAVIQFFITFGFIIVYLGNALKKEG